LRFTWCPIELSAVSIPADPSAGFYRHLTLEKNMGTTNTNTEQSHQTRSQKRAATGELDRIALSNQEERNRCAEITAMGRAHNCPDLAEDLVRENVDLAQAREAVLDWVTSRRPRQLPANRDYTDAGDYIDMHNEAKDFSIVRAINAVVNSSWKGAGLERAASEAVAKRIGRESSGGFFFPLDARLTRSPYSTGGGNTGAALLATNLLASSFIEVLRNKVRVIELGATMLSGLVGNVDIPRRSAATPISWIGEAGSLTDGEGTLDKLQLAPKTVGALSTISRNMLMQSTPDIEMLVRSDMIAVLGLGIDLAAINGLGSANQPLGILNTVGVGQVVLGTNGAQISLDNLLDLVKTVMNANADAGSLAFLTNPSVVGFLSKLKATTNQYLWDRGENQNNFGPVSGSGVGGQNLLSAVGQKMAITNQVPSNLTKGTANGTCSAVIFGNWQDVVIGEWGVLEILPNPYDSVQYPKGSVLIRALQTIDIGIRHPQSFAIINDALTV
jgi:HK97 family phage major capsid protein